jgi:hypothetical protein
MKILKALAILIRSILLQGLLLIPNIIVMALKVSITMLVVASNTLTYLIEQVKHEVLK